VLTGSSRLERTVSYLGEPEAINSFLTVNSNDSRAIGAYPHRQHAAPIEHRKAQLNLLQPHPAKSLRKKNTPGKP
jgi:hypothetical protein